MRGGYVDDGESRVDLSGLLRDLPSIKLAQQIDVGHERAVRGDAPLQQGHSLFTRSGNSRLKTAFRERIFNDALNGIVIFNHENNGLIFQRQLPRLPSQTHHAEAGILFPEKRSKVNLRNLRPEVLHQRKHPRSQNVLVREKVLACFNPLWPSSNFAVAYFAFAAFTT